MRTGEEGPADLDLIGRLVVAVKPRRPDHPSGAGLQRQQRSPGIQRVLKEGFETGRLRAALVGVLLPDQGVGRDRE
jgi:hypothetical protein